MEDSCRVAFNDSHLASRKAEEAASRRFQAARWLESMVGPTGLTNEPSEQDFLFHLRNGLILCNTINKIHPGSVPKVVENHLPKLHSEAQSLPLAFQYFENVRNFLVAVKDLNLPTFEASDLERDTLEAGTTKKLVDCILALKSYQEWKQYGGSGNGHWKYAKSPLVSANKIQCHSGMSTPSNACRHLDMRDSAPVKKLLGEVENPKLGHSNDMVESVVKVLSDCLFDIKENVDQRLLAQFHGGNVDACARIISSCLQEKQLSVCPELKSIVEDNVAETKSFSMTPISRPLEDLSLDENCKRSFLKESNCKRRHLLETQEKDLMELKALLNRIKEDFQALQFQLQNDVMQLGNQVQGMSVAALGYHRVMNENRRLHNTLQDLKGNIRVYCRIRPAFIAGFGCTLDFIEGDGSLIIVDPCKTHRDSSKGFQFNRVFGPTATQDEVFKDTQPLIRSVMDGYNVCIFAYGQTGSGKTHTMCGPSSGSCKDMGINYLALKDLFHISHERKDLMKYEVHVQMVEIYNEQVRDLLASAALTKKLEIRTCTGNDWLSLPDANMHLVQSTMDVLNLMKLGERNRAVSSTAVNERSSRSHSVLTVHVQGKDKSGSILHSCLHLVDLAGSERVEKSEVTGERLKEAQHINKSLSCLGDVIAALAQKSAHIPYRNSKLTQLLQYSLGGQAKTLMFAHVSPEADSYGETISTLNFAQRVSTVELGAARLNKESNYVRKLKEQVESLKKELAKKDGESTTTKEMRTPLEIMRLKNELTPPRPRRLSIENQNIGKSQEAIKSASKPVKTPVRRGRRLSLEGGTKHVINGPQSTTNKAKDVQVGTRSISGIELEPCFPSRGNEICGSVGLNTELSHQLTPSPTSIGSNSVTLKAGRMRIPLRLPKSPEPPTLTITPISCSSAPRKGSQIKKSLQSIGKFINGMDKRKQCESKTPALVPSNHNEAKTPITTKARLMRRQSITGSHVLPLDISRRASLGGNSTDSHSSVIQNARTPPSVQSLAKISKKWL